MITVEFRGGGMDGLCRQYDEWPGEMFDVEVRWAMEGHPEQWMLQGYTYDHFDSATGRHVYRHWALPKL
jgi:hypothetical protein